MTTARDSSSRSMPRTSVTASVARGRYTPRSWPCTVSSSSSTRRATRDRASRRLPRYHASPRTRRSRTGAPDASWLMAAPGEQVRKVHLVEDRLVARIVRHRREAPVIDERHHRVGDDQRLLEHTHRLVYVIEPHPSDGEDER